ncbi:MAG: MarR family transcriptional regulator [Clostridia bacterium]|nr:MarR family transcriptional regulator [Clostridia bacterium]
MDDLTIIEINTILVIGENTRSMSEIASSLGVTSGTPTVTMDRLILKGYAVRIRDEEDRRQVFVRLSERGLEVYKTVIAIKDKVSERIFSILDENETKTMIQALTKINYQFDEMF